jgi:hypothetical protein
MKLRPADGAHAAGCAAVIVSEALIATQVNSAATMIFFMQIPGSLLL